MDSFMENEYQVGEFLDKRESQVCVGHENFESNQNSQLLPHDDNEKIHKDVCTSRVNIQTGGRCKELDNANSIETESNEIYESFAHMPSIPKWLSDQLLSIGIEKPTDVQIKTIPPITRGLNVIGAACTGQGKTLCFALPIIIDCVVNPGAFRALILVPSRELALQIGDQFHVLADQFQSRIQVIIGGQSILSQLKELGDMPHIIIASPGRLVDLMKNSSSKTVFLRFRRIKYFVIDEADRLLQADFAEDLKKIIKCLPPTRQTLLFSATLTKNMERLIELCGSGRKSFVYKNLERSFDSDLCEFPNINDMTFQSIRTDDGNVLWPTPPKLAMHYVFVPRAIKECYLTYLVKKYLPTGVIVFVATCELCEIICTTMNYLIKPKEAVRMHKLMKQSERIKALDAFKSGRSKVLFATDLASRGLDIPYVNLVIHLNVPELTRDYIHRVGRVARKDRYGTSILLIDQFEVDKFLRIEKELLNKVTEFSIVENEVTTLLKDQVNAKELARNYLEKKGFFDRLEILKSRKG